MFRNSLSASQSKPAPESFSFPMLKGGEILQCMAELSVPLTEADLMEPEKNKANIRRAMLYLIELCTGVTRDSLCTPAFAGLECLSYEELHEDSIPELAYLRATDKMMRICGINDYGLKDITMPNSKRLRRQLSGIINFAKFREERLQMYGELNLQREELGDKLRQMNDDNKDLNSQLDVLRRQSEGEMEIVKNVEAECREIEAKIGVLNKQQAAIRHESGELKKQGNDLKDRNATIALAIREGAAEEKKLSGQIVSSPDRVRREMANATSRLEAEKAESLTIERDAACMKNKAVSVTKAAKEVGKVVTALEEVECEVSKYASTTEEIRNTHATIEGNKEKELEANALIAGHERTIAKYDEKTAFLRKSAAVKTQSAQTNLLESQNVLMKVEKERRDGMQRISQLEQDVRAEERLIDEDAVRAMAETEMMIKEYRKMESVVLSHQQGLVQQLVV
jgi:kinetochore protein Nuf2